MKILSDVIFGSHVGYLTVADKLPVYIKVKTGVYTFKYNVFIENIHIVFNDKIGRINAGRGGLWHTRQIDRERVAHVCILRSVISVKLPVRWYKKPVPF